MKLDKFDSLLLEQHGDAQDIMYEMYNKKIGLNNAEKQLAGIRTHVKFKESRIDLTEQELSDMETIVTHPNGTVTTTRMLLLSTEDSKDPRRLLELMGYDPLQWKVKSSKVHRTDWNVTMKLRKVTGYDDTGKPIYENFPNKQTNHAYKCELTAEPIQDIITTKDVDRIFENLPASDINDYIYDEGDRGLEFGLVDFHFGNNLSIKDEIKLFKHTVLSTLGKIDSYQIDLEKIWFQIGQDFIHIDSSNKTTTHGTQLQTRSEWSEVYDGAVECLLWSAEQFRRVCPIEYIYVPGNHDKTLSYCLAKTLEKVYWNSSAVTVDTIDYPRKYRKYGVNAFGLSHGREEGKRIRTKFQEEAPDMLATTQYREFHLADKHHEEAMEDGEIIYRILPTITELDNWHISKGYKALRRCTSYLWNPDGGKDILEVLIKI